MGVVDAPAFRDLVRRLRNLLEIETPGDHDGLGHTGPRRATDLSDIHETLKRIERHLERMADNEFWIPVELLVLKMARSSEASCR